MEKEIRDRQFANFPVLEEVISQGRIDNTEVLSLSLSGNMPENLDRLQQSFKSQCKRKLLKNRERLKNFQCSMYSLGGDLCTVILG